MAETVHLTGGLPAPTTRRALAAGQAAAREDMDPDAAALGNALAAFAEDSALPAPAPPSPGAAWSAEPTPPPARVAPTAQGGVGDEEPDIFDLPLVPRPPAGNGAPVVGAPPGTGLRPTVAGGGPIAATALAPSDGILGRAAPTRVLGIVSAGDMVRVTQVNGHGKELLIEDYKVQEIGAHGDFGAFVKKYLAPTYGGGEYRLNKSSGRAGVFQVVDTVMLPGTPNGGGSGRGGGEMPTTVEMIKLMRDERNDALAEERRQREAAEQAADKAAAEAEARANTAAQSNQQLMLEMLKSKGKEGGSGGMASMVETMMMMRMLEGFMGPPAATPTPAPAGLTAWEVQSMMQQQAQQLQVQLQAQQPLPPPPPMPEPPAPTDWGAIFGGAAALIGAVVAPIVAAIANRPPPPDPMTYLGPVLAAALAPRQDPALAVITAKMDMMMNGEAPDPLEQIERVATIIKSLQPGAGADMASALVKLVDRGPELIDATGRAFQRALTPAVASVVDRSGGVPQVQVAPERAAAAAAAPQPPVVPEPLIQLRDAILAVPSPAGGDTSAEIQQLLVLLQQTLPALAGAGQPWAGIVQHLFTAATDANVEEVRRGIASLLGHGWGKTPPAPTKEAFLRLFRAYAHPPFLPGAPTIAELLADELRRMAKLPPRTPAAPAAPAGEAAASAEPGVRAAPEGATRPRVAGKPTGGAKAATAASGAAGAKPAPTVSVSGIDPDDDDDDEDGDDEDGDDGDDGDDEDDGEDEPDAADLS